MGGSVLTLVNLTKLTLEPIVILRIMLIWIGRWFNFGDHKLIVRTAGGFNKEIVIAGITDPFRYEKMFEKFV